MIESYLTADDACAETVISKSRFLTYLYRIGSEQDAQDRLRELRKKYYDATHICYAYIADKEGRIQKFSDDGEPSGTAGQPILEAVKAHDLREVLVAVVRYFGGVKLGAGGLVRAYRGCASDCMKNSRALRYTLSDLYNIRLDFSLSKKTEQFMSNLVCKIEKLEYNMCVTMTVAAPVNTDIAAQITDFTNGKAEIEKIGTTYILYNQA